MDLLLKVIEWAGASWWIWAWGIFVAFQFLVLLLAPTGTGAVVSLALDGIVLAVLLNRR